METPHFEIIWTEYMQYRAKLRGFELDEIERIVRYTDKRYVDRTLDSDRTTQRCFGADSL